MTKLRCWTAVVVGFLIVSPVLVFYGVARSQVLDADEACGAADGDADEACGSADGDAHEVRGR